MITLQELNQLLNNVELAHDEAMANGDLYPDELEQLAWGMIESIELEHALTVIEP